MRGIVAEANAQGDVRLLGRLLETGRLRELWAELHFKLLEFDDLGLADDAPDAVIWHACQRGGVALITRNRNSNGPESLEVTIRNHNTPESLPVFTLADGDRLHADRTYAQETADRLFDYLFEIENYRGAGRLFLP